MKICKWLLWVFVFWPFSFESKAQNSVCSRLVFEYNKNDTGIETVFDTIFLGVDTMGGPGFQVGLDKYIDTSTVPGVYFIDSIFSIQFPSKYLKTSIDKFQLETQTTRFKVRSRGWLKNIYWNPNDFRDFRTGKFFFTFGINGPEGSSIGSWDANSMILILGNYYTSGPKIEIYELPFYSVLSFVFNCVDSSLIGGVKIVYEPNFMSYITPNNELLIQSDDASFWDKLKIKIFSIEGNEVECEIIRPNTTQGLINFKNLHPGYYIYQIAANNNFSVGKIYVIK